MATCECGCGGTPRSDKRFVHGHNGKSGVADPSEYPDPNPSGLCMCGCGERTAVSTTTARRAQRYRGRHVRFISGHHSRVILGADRVQWKGGRITTAEGYAKVRIGAGRGAKYVLEHRVVMAEMLGRPLAINEQVHHINGDKLDNRPENLELWHRSQPNGVRREDYHCPGCCCPR